MSKFIQLHILTSYPPSNLNRDDLGRPKTAIMGGKTRLRVSSQSLKRAWRQSPVFQENLEGHLSTRTKQLGTLIYHELIKADFDEADSRKAAETLAAQLGKRKSAKKDDPLNDLQNETLAFLSADEIASAKAAAKAALDNNEPIDEKSVDIYKKKTTAVDLAMFGRMVAATPTFNVEAAVQVAHAITTHAVTVEDDYFTAVDDLNFGEEDAGAGHVGEVEFGAGVFYLYVCIDREALIKNLNNDNELANRAIAALVESAATVSPTGKQNSFASRAYANYVIAETGSRQPRTLASAFVKPVSGHDQIRESITRIESELSNFDKVYGPCADASYTMNAYQGEGQLKSLTEFVTNLEN